MKISTIISTCMFFLMFLNLHSVALADTLKGENSAVTAQNKHLIMRTPLGNIEIELYSAKAPVTVANFLKYFNAGAYDGGSFYRVVRADNDNGQPKITVIQAEREKSNKEWPPIILETTQQTGIKHLDGTLSMARDQHANSATSSFFICLGAQASLDFGGARIADGLGFAAFGRVTKGMEVVRKINQIKQAQSVDDEYLKGQLLTQPVVISVDEGST